MKKLIIVFLLFVTGCGLGVESYQKNLKDFNEGPKKISIGGSHSGMTVTQIITLDSTGLTWITAEKGSTKVGFSSGPNHGLSVGDVVNVVGMVSRPHPTSEKIGFSLDTGEDLK